MKWSTYKHKDSIVGGLFIAGLFFFVVAAIMGMFGIWSDVRWGYTAFFPGMVGLFGILLAVFLA